MGPYFVIRRYIEIYIVSFCFWDIEKLKIAVKHRKFGEYIDII